MGKLTNRNYLSKLNIKDRELLKSIGLSCRYYRENLNLFQKDVAEYIGCSVATISGFELGRYDSLRIYYRYTEFLRIKSFQ